MKKSILLYLFFIIFVIYSNSNAASFIPLSGPNWDGKTVNEIMMSPLHEEAFLELYQITEQDVNSEDAFHAFGYISAIYGNNLLDEKLERNFIQSTELRQLLTTLHASTANPQSAKDHFYKGLFSYVNSVDIVDYPPLYEHFQYVIDNYPDSVYAEYSYVFMADNYAYTGAERYDDAINILVNGYLAKYGSGGKITPFVYLRLSYVDVGQYLRVSIRQQDKDRVAVMQEYSNKLLTEFPERKDLTGEVFANLGFYYRSYKKDFDKAIEYYLKAYNDPAHHQSGIHQGLRGAIHSYKAKREYQNALNLLEDSKKHFFNVPNKDFFDNAQGRQLYKEMRLNIEEAKHFGFDSFDDSEGARNIYKQKETEIKQFRSQYHQSFDANYNIIAPIPVPGQ